MWDAEAEGNFEILRGHEGSMEAREESMWPVILAIIHCEGACLFQSAGV